MVDMLFQAIDEALPGPKWSRHFAQCWPDYEAWFLREGAGRRPSYMASLRAMQQHMPELVPMWQHLCELGGGSDRVARMLSLYRPTPYLSGCSQAVWLRDQPLLVRNYDYHPEACEGLLLQSAWHGTRVIALSDSLWGALDGMNEHGLAASLTFGGRRVVGSGFGIPLIVRYILEFCRTVAEGVAVLQRVPSHMSYTIALVDAGGDHAMVYVNPDRPTVVTRLAVATNHQQRIEWPQHAAFTQTQRRSVNLSNGLVHPDETVRSFCARFLAAPLARTSYARSFGTLYTAIYWPTLGRMHLRWPHLTWEASFTDFVERSAVVALHSS